MIAPSRSAAYRRFYLYSALSVAMIALAVAAGLLLREGLQQADLGARSITQDSSRAVALAAALVALAVPVGGAHLWLIGRSLGDPAERASTIRHQFLNLWLAFGAVVVLFAGQSAIGTAVRDARPDVTGQASVMAVAAAVVAIAAWWITRTPPATPQDRVRAAIVVLVVAMAVAAFSLAGAAAAAGGLFQYPYGSPGFRPQGYDPRSFNDQTLRSGYLVAGLGLAVWAFGFAWQRRWPATRDRLGYALAGYGAGSALLLAGVAFTIGGAARFARDPAQAAAFTAGWGPLAAGALLVATHAALLLADRGRNGHPAVTTTRLLLAFPAIIGLAMIVGALGLAWHAVLERDIVTAAHLADDLTQAAAVLAVGAIAFAPSWRAFDARSPADSAVRRFYFFTVVCLSLVAGLVSGVVVLYETITTVAGVGDADSGRTALTWLVPALALAAIFALHLRLLLRDQRRSRSTPAPLPPADPLIALLEEVRAGRMSVEGAAATIRGPGA